MKYTNPEHPHEFTHYDDRALDGLSFAELNHLMYVDRVLCDPRHSERSDIELERMSDDDLRAMLGESEPVKPRKRARLPHMPPLVPVIPKPKPFYSAPRTVSPLRYKATVWENGRSVSLGWFMTESVRDEVVAEAKRLRSIGLPVLLAKPR